MEKLRAEVGRLTHQIEQHEETIVYHEQLVEDAQKDGEALRQKLKETEEQRSQLYDEKIEVEISLRRAENEYNKAHADALRLGEQCKENEKTINQTEDEISRMKDVHKERIAEEKRYREVDVAGLRQQANEYKGEIDASTKEVDDLKEQLLKFKGIEAELEEQKEIVASLRQQREIQRTEGPRFDLNPLAYRQSEPKERPAQYRKTSNLQIELENPAKYQVDSSFDSSDSDETQVVKTRTVRIIKEVPVPMYQHSLFRCLYYTVLNFLHLGFLWACDVFHRVDPIVRRTFGLPPSTSPPLPRLPHQLPAKSAFPKSPQSVSSLGKNSIFEQSQSRPGTAASEQSQTNSLQSDDLNFRHSSERDSGDFSMPGSLPKMMMAQVSRGGSSEPLSSPQPSMDSPRSDLSALLDPYQAPDTRNEVIPLASNGDARSDGGARAHTHAPFRRRHLTAEEAESLYPTGEGEAEADETIVYADAGSAPDQPAWQRITNTDPRHRPDAWQTMHDMLWWFVLFFICFQTWLFFRERQRWTDANGISRAFFDDLFTHRNQFGRGVTASVFPEPWAGRIELLGLWFMELFGVELKAYPRPG